MHLIPHATSLLLSLNCSCLVQVAIYIITQTIFPERSFCFIIARSFQPLNKGKKKKKIKTKTETYRYLSGMGGTGGIVEPERLMLIGGANAIPGFC